MFGGPKKQLLLAVVRADDFFFAGGPQRPCTTRTYYVCSLASKCMYLSVCQPDVWLGTDIYSPFSAVVVDFIYFSAVATAAVDESNYDEN